MNPQLGDAVVIQGNARHLPLADDSVDLIVTSPPYWALRSYKDDGEHYDGQIGSERTPAEFLDSLIDVTRECVRVLKPSGTLWVNLGDKYGSDKRGTRPQGETGQRADRAHARQYASAADQRFEFDTPYKSLMGLPWRYALRCIDELGLILRAEVIWNKLSATPESVVDRPRRSHEQWFAFSLEPRYFASIDLIREPHKPSSLARIAAGFNPTGRDTVATSHNGVFTTRGRGDHVDGYDPNPLGSLPGSVWDVAGEPLTIPEHVAHGRCCGGHPVPGCDRGIQHFAAFPSWWPRRIILGWGPTLGVCTACGQGRRPTTASESAGAPVGPRLRHVPGFDHPNRVGTRGVFRHVTGESCGCDQPDAPTRRGVVLDPFGGTGTTAMVAKALGMTGISVDGSADYSWVARWRTNDRDQLAKQLGIGKAPTPAPPDHDDLFTLL